MTKEDSISEESPDVIEKITKKSVKSIPTRDEIISLCDTIIKETETEIKTIRENRG